MLKDVSDEMATALMMSLSVTIPTGSQASVTMMLPISFSVMRRAAALTITPFSTVINGELMMTSMMDGGLSDGAQSPFNTL